MTVRLRAGAKPGIGVLPDQRVRAKHGLSEGESAVLSMNSHVRLRLSSVNLIAPTTTSTPSARTQSSTARRIERASMSAHILASDSVGPVDRCGTARRYAAQ